MTVNLNHTHNMACALTQCHAPTHTTASPITIPRNPPQTWQVKYESRFDVVLYDIVTMFIYYRRAI